MPNVEFWLEPGGDFEQLPNGDIRLAYDDDTHSDATRQRIVRTLLTNPRIVVNGLAVSSPDDIFAPDFGAGLPALVGQSIPFVISQATARINEWISDLASLQPGTLEIDIEQQGIATVLISISCDTKTGSQMKTTFPLGPPTALAS